MAELLEIPTNAELDDYQFSIAIDGVIYFFYISYNYRISRYTLSILDSLRQPLVNGIPILTNVTLTDNFKYLEIPKDEIIPLSFDSENAEYQDLGDKVRLYYYKKG